MKEVHFRKATPKDVDQVVPLILESGPEAFAYVLNNGVQTARDFLKFAFPQKGGEFSYDNHFVLETESSIVGVGAVYSHEKSKGFLIKDFKNIVKVYKYRSIGAVSRGLRIERVLVMPEKREHYIGHIAVLETERGNGYGKSLMQKIFGSISIEAGESFVLDVDVDNFRAKRLYDKLGFEVACLMKSSLKTQYGRVPSHYRMVKRSV